MADSIAWIEETPGNQQQPPITKSPPEESSTESNATIVETAVFRIDPPEDEVKPIGMNEYANVNGHAGAHSDSQFDPFIHIPRGRWDIAGSTTSDPIQADDSESTSTVLTTATEDPKIYRETDKEREGIDDDELKPLRSAQLNKIRLEAEANQDYSPDAPRSSSKYSVDPNGSIFVQLYTPSEWESQKQDAKESTPLATWQPTQTSQQQDGQPCSEITLNVTIKRIPKDSDEQIVEATNLNGQVKLNRERRSENLEATGDKESGDDKTSFQRPGQEATTSVELPSQDLNKFAIDQQIQVQQFGHDVVAREDNKINEEKERQVVEIVEDVKDNQQFGQKDSQAQQIGQNDSQVSVPVQQFGQNDSQIQQTDNSSQQFGQDSVPVQQKDNFGTLACELQVKDNQNQQIGQDSVPVQQFGQDSVPVQQVGQNDSQVQQFGQESASVQQFGQDSVPVQQTDSSNPNVHEVQFKSFSGEEYSQHELAPSISAIIMDHKEDRTLTASPKPEKRVNFSEQLVKRYPESPTDAKSFGPDALLQKDVEEARKSQTGWQDVRPASAESNDQGGEVRTTNFNLDVSIERKPEEATKSETKPIDSTPEAIKSETKPLDSTSVVQDVKNPDEIDYSFSTNLSTDTTRLDDEKPTSEASKNDDKQIDVNFLSGLGKKPAEDQLSIDRDDNTSIDTNFSMDTIEKKPDEVNNGLSDFGLEQRNVIEDDKPIEVVSFEPNFEKKPDNEVNSSFAPEIDKLEFKSAEATGLDKPGDSAIEVVSFEPSFEKKSESEVNSTLSSFVQDATGDKPIEVVSFEPSFEKKTNELDATISSSVQDTNKPGDSATETTGLDNPGDSTTGLENKPIEVVSFEPSFEKKPDDLNNKQEEVDKPIEVNSVVQDSKEDIRSKFDAIRPDDLLKIDPKEQIDILTPIIEDVELPVKKEDGLSDVPPSGEETTPNELARSAESSDVPAKIEEEIKVEAEGDKKWIDVKDDEQKPIDSLTDNQKVEEQKQSESAKPLDYSNVEEQKPFESTTDNQNIDVQKPFESTTNKQNVDVEKVEEQKPFESAKTFDSNVESTKPPDSNFEEQKQSDFTTNNQNVQKAEEQKPFESTTNNQKVEEQKPFDPSNIEEQKQFESAEPVDSSNIDVIQKVDEQKPSDSSNVEEQKPFELTTNNQKVESAKPSDSTTDSQNVESAKPSESFNQSNSSNDDQNVEEQKQSESVKPSDSNTEQPIQWTEQPAQQEQTTPSDGIQWIEQKTGGDQPTDSTLQVSTQPVSGVKTATPSPQAEPPNEEPNDRQKHESIVSWLLDKPKIDDVQWQAPGSESKRVDSDAKSASSGGQEVKPDTQQKSTNEETPSTSVEKQSDNDKRVTRMEEVPSARRGSYEKDENRDVNAELDAYGQRLIQNTREALALVDALCQDTLERQERRKRHLSGGPLDTLTNELSADQLHQKVTRPPITEFDDLEVEVYRVNPELMEEPKSCVLLPEAKLLILDAKMGLTLMDLPTKETKRCGLADDWRDVEHACYMKKHNQILLVYEQRVDDQNFQKYLARFDLQLQMLSKCEAPKYIQDKVVTTCRVCYVDETDCIYLAVNTPNDCFLYELTADCKWTEVYNMRNRQIADICKLATVGPVTELLVLDSNKRHILLLCIYNSALAERAMIAFCAEPAALTVDEHDNLIVFDRATNLVGIHSRLHFERIRDLVVVGRANCSLSAREGNLALLNQMKKELRICKY